MKQKVWRLPGVRRQADMFHFPLVSVMRRCRIGGQGVEGSRFKGCKFKLYQISLHFGIFMRGILMRNELHPLPLAVNQKLVGFVYTFRFFRGS